MRTQLVAFLCIVQAAIPIRVVAAQDTVSIYDVKFVCGLRPPPAAGNAETWLTVAPGRYFTAINILNASSDTARLWTTVAIASPLTMARATHPGPGVAIPPGAAVEIDCRDIRATRRPPPFLKGFLQIVSAQRLSVVAVYTAANSGGVATIDVEHQSASRAESCPDLALGRITSLVALQRTFLTIGVGNIGGADAGAFAVRVEDPNRAGADRIAEKDVVGLGAGEQTTVNLQLPYRTSDNAALVVNVDPKMVIAECREDNNIRTAGAP